MAKFICALLRKMRSKTANESLIGCTWVPLGLEVVSWLRWNIPMSSVDLAGLLLPLHLRRCGLAAGGGELPCVIGVCRVNTSVLQSAGVHDPTLAY
jgi:hypothetical protein